MKDSPRYQEELQEHTTALKGELEAGAYVEASLHPSRRFFNPDLYYYEPPRASDYSIGLLIDPCKGNSPGCCHRAYGAPEYRMLKEPVSEGREVPLRVQAPPDAILRDVAVVDEDGAPISASASRWPDDETSVDDTCAGDNDPDSACVGYRMRERRSRLVPPCLDNNDTVAGGAPCDDGRGGGGASCVAVAIAQTALAVRCGGAFANSTHCGTFLEVHVPAPNDYATVETVVAETRIAETNITGYVTTTVPLTWRGNATRVLCAYELPKLFPSASVLVAPDAPLCCIPGEFSQSQRNGAFWCPAASTASRGPFARTPATAAERAAAETAAATYPYCLSPSDGGAGRVDELLISEWSAGIGRFYTRAVAPMRQVGDLWTSDDLAGHYEDVCPYFEGGGCSSTGACHAGDARFTFAKRVGTVVDAPVEESPDATAATGVFSVTFNGGRTAYPFERRHLTLELDHNYELWWVQRTRTRLVVQKRKAFTVTQPRCTFDTVNNQYFPFAELDAHGDPIP